MADFFDNFFAASGMVERKEQTAWQRAEHEAHGKDPKRAFFCSPRLGKSLPALAAQLESGLDRLLITCPLVAAPQWERLVEAAGAVAVPLYDRSCAKAAATLEKTRNGVVILNDDKLPMLTDELLRWGVQYGIGDESHRFAGVSAKRARVYRRLAWHADGYRILTGTPVPNHYGNLWGQMVGLGKDDWGSSYERFAQHFLIRDSMFPSVVIGYQNEPELYALIRKWATIVRREDIFGPDSWQQVTRAIRLPEKAAKIYYQLAKEWILEAPVNLEATHTLSRMTRLHQLTSGFLPDADCGDTEDAYYEAHRAKRDAILADLDGIVQAREKAVIFHRFTPEGWALFSDISKAYADSAEVLKIDGGTSSVDRDGVYDAVEKHEGPVIAVVQTQSGGIARSFAEAQHVMFASRGFSFVEEEQARDRVYAVTDVDGETKSKRRMVYDYVAEGTIDEYILSILATKETIHQALRHADRENIVFGSKLRRPRQKRVA